MKLRISPRKWSKKTEVGEKMRKLANERPGCGTEERVGRGVNRGPKGEKFPQNTGQINALKLS